MSTSEDKGGWGGYRPGAGRPKGSKALRPPLKATLQLGDQIAVVIVGPQPGDPPMAFTAEITQLDKTGDRVLITAQAADGTTLTLV